MCTIQWTQSIKKIKHINSPMFITLVQICLAISRRRSVQILSLSEDKFVLLKELQLSEPPIYMVSRNLSFVILIKC